MAIVVPERRAAKGSESPFHSFNYKKLANVCSYQGLVITQLHDYQFLFVLLHGSFFLELFGISKQLQFLLESTPNNRLPDSFFYSF